MMINSNVMALGMQSRDAVSQSASSKAMQSLSSGSRINSAKDDAAGSALIEQFAAQIAGSNQAVRNLNDGISLAQTAEGVLSSISDNTDRLRELTVAAGNGTLSASDRQAMQAEADALSQSNADMVKNAQFNGQALLQGGAFNFQSGLNVNDLLSLNNPTLNGANGLASAAGSLDLSSASAANSSLSLLDRDIELIAGQRAQLGAFQNRIDSGIQNLQTSALNLSAAKSRVADTDYAAATAQWTQNQVRNNANLAMQVQARANAGQVLSLLR